MEPTFKRYGPETPTEAIENSLKESREIIKKLETAFETLEKCDTLLARLDDNATVLCKLGVLEDAEDINDQSVILEEESDYAGMKFETRRESLRQSLRECPMRISEILRQVLDFNTDENLRQRITDLAEGLVRLSRSIEFKNETFSDRSVESLLASVGRSMQ